MHEKKEDYYEEIRNNPPLHLKNKIDDMTEKEWLFLKKKISWINTYRCFQLC